MMSGAICDFKASHVVHSLNIDNLQQVGVQI